MSLIKIIEELQEKDRRIAKLEKAIRYAINIRNLWGNPVNSGRDIAEQYKSETQAIQVMEDSFYKLIETKN